MFFQAALPISGISHTSVLQAHKDKAGSPFHAVKFERESRVGPVPKEFVVSPDPGGDDDFRISASSIYSVT